LRFPPTVEVKRVTALLLFKVALPDPDVFKLTVPVNELEVLSRVIAWPATSVVKLDVPPTVKIPVSVIAPPEVTLKFPVAVTFTPKSTADPASKVKLLNEDAVVEKVIVEAEFKMSDPKLDEDTPSTIMAPLDPLPTVRLPAVIWPSSLFVREKVPKPEPKPMVVPD
jgi:hypothetical protein